MVVVVRGVLYILRGRGRFTLRICEQQGVVAEHVDPPWDAAAGPLQLTDRGAREQSGYVSAARAQPVLDVVVDLFARQDRQQCTRADPLIQLAQLRSGQPPGELDLDHQHDLQPPALERLKVGQQPQVLERVVAQILRLVDNDRDAFFRPETGELRIERLQQRQLVRPLRMADAELAEYLAEHLLEAEARIRHPRAADSLVPRREQRIDERGLAGPDFADQHREPARLAQPPFERGQSLAMARAHEEHRCRRIELEGRAAQPEMFVIHIGYILSSRIATVLSPVSLKIEAVEQILGSYSS